MFTGERERYNYPFYISELRGVWKVGTKHWLLYLRERAPVPIVKKA
jgi:hypothetical protein